MLSQSHGMSFILFWLKSWFASQKKPDEIITDESDALMGACVEAFTRFKSINTYISACVNLFLLEDFDLPECFLRIDRSHFVKSIHRSKHLKRQEKRKQNLFKRILGYLIQCESMEEFKNIVRDTLLILRNPFFTTETTAAKMRLQRLVDTHEVYEILKLDEDMETNDDSFCDGFHDEIVNTFKDTSSYKFIMTISNTIEIENNKDLAENLYYSPDLEPYFIYIFVRFPLWTNIMCSKFRSTLMTATSSAIESEFKNMKKLVKVSTQKNDVFVSRHLDHLQGLLKLAISDQKLADRSNIFEETNDDTLFNGNGTIEEVNMEYSSTSEAEAEGTSDVNESDETIEPFENWRNQVLKQSGTRRANSSILNPQNFQLNKISVVPNGHSSHRKFNKKLIITRNTCAFDSLLFVYLVSFVDYDEIKQIFKMSKSPFLQLVVNWSENRDKVDSILDKRNEILYHLFNQKKQYPYAVAEDENVIDVNCTTGE